MTLLKKVFIFVSFISFMGCAVVVKEQAPQKSGKVAVCHKGKNTLHVDESAVKAHLDHGDYIGVCK